LQLLAKLLLVISTKIKVVIAIDTAFQLTMAQLLGFETRQRQNTEWGLGPESNP